MAKKVFIIKQTPIDGKKAKAGSTVSVDDRTAKLLVGTKKAVYEDDVTDELKARVKATQEKAKPNAKGQGKTAG